MEPTIAIRFPTLSDPGARTTVHTYDDKIAATAKTTTIVHYTQTVITVDTPETARTSVSIEETGLYLFVLVTGELMMERTGADDVALVQSTNHCQALYLCKGDYFISFARGRHRLVCFASSTAWIRRIKQALPLINEVSATMLPYQQALIFPNVQLPGVLADQLLSLSYQSANETAAGELDCFHKLNRIMAHYDGLLAKAKSAAATHRNYTDIVRDFIRHCSHSLLDTEFSSIEEIAAAINVSSKTLNRAFRSVSRGTATPGRLLLELRMAMARQLLSESENVSVQHVAHLLGYADKSAFTKAYRKVWGHLPSEARTVRNKPPQSSGTTYLSAT